MAENWLDLGVVESRWWAKSNDSVRGLFDLLAGMYADNPFAYHYEMFNNAPSIQEIIPRIASDPDIHHVYIAAHGNADGLRGAGKNRVRHDVLGRIIENVETDRLYGVYLGCCKLGLRIQDLITRSGLTWLAGYTEAVDWVGSSAMDLFFWNEYLGEDVPETKSERYDAMADLLKRMYVRVPFMFVDLGFKVALSRRRGSCQVFPDDFDIKSLQTELYRYVS